MRNVLNSGRIYFIGFFRHRKWTRLVFLSLWRRLCERSYIMIARTFSLGPEKPSGGIFQRPIAYTSNGRGEGLGKKMEKMGEFPGKAGAISPFGLRSFFSSAIQTLFIRPVRVTYCAHYMSYFINLSIFTVGSTLLVFLCCRFCVLNLILIFWKFVI